MMIQRMERMGFASTATASATKRTHTHRDTPAHVYKVRNECLRTTQNIIRLSHTLPSNRHRLVNHTFIILFLQVFHLFWSGRFICCPATRTTRLISNLFLGYLFIRAPTIYSVMLSSPSPPHIRSVWVCVNAIESHRWRDKADIWSNSIFILFLNLWILTNAMRSQHPLRNVTMEMAAGLRDDWRNAKQKRKDLCAHIASQIVEWEIDWNSVKFPRIVCRRAQKARRWAREKQKSKSHLCACNGEVDLRHGACIWFDCRLDAIRWKENEGFRREWKNEER